MFAGTSRFTPRRVTDTLVWFCRTRNARGVYEVISGPSTYNNSFFGLFQEWGEFSLRWKPGNMTLKWTPALRDSGW